MRHTAKLVTASAFVLSLGLSSVAYSQQTAGQYVDDATITAKLKAAILADSQLKSMQVSVETTNGVVQLTGAVDTKAQESEAIKVANQINGVRSVKDLIAVKGTQDE